MSLQQDPGWEGGGLGGQGPTGIPQMGVSGGGTPQPYQPGRVSINGNSAPMAAPQMGPNVREQGRNAGFNPSAISRFFSNSSPDMNAVYLVPPGTADAWRTNGAPASWDGTPSVGNPQTQAANQNPTGFGTPSWDPSQQRPSDSYTNGGMNRFGMPNGQEMAQRGFSNWQAQNQNNPFGNYSFNAY